MPQISQSGVDAAGSIEQQLLDLLLADEELLRAEFDAILAEVWPAQPPNLPHRRAGEPDPGGKQHHRDTASTAPDVRARPQGASARQRSPPAGP